MAKSAQTQELPKDFADEINKATLGDVKPDPKPADPDPEPDKDEKPESDAKPDAEAGEPEDEATDVPEDEDEVTPPSEEVVERAIRAGMTLKDANAIKDGDALSRIVESLERSNTAKAAKEGDASKVVGEDGDLLSRVPDLDPAEYTADVVKVFKAMKEVLADQHKTITELLKRGSSEPNSIDKKIADLGREWSDVFGKDGKGKADLEEAIKFVTKINPNLPPDKVFDRALRAAFSEKASAIEKQKLSNAAKARADRAVERPRNLTGRFASEKEGAPKMTDAEAEAKAVDEVKAMLKD